MVAINRDYIINELWLEIASGLAMQGDDIDSMAEELTTNAKYNVLLRHLGRDELRLRVEEMLNETKGE